MSINKYFKKHFETQCFQLIKEAYDFAIQDKVIKLDWYENDVTTALNDYIEDSLKRKKFHIISTVDPPIRKDDIKKEKGYANKRARIDIRLIKKFSTLEYKYYMEAKKLKEKDSKLKRRYINTGMNSFLSGKYPKGCLLGYIFKGDIDKTVYGINKLLKKDGKISDILELKPHDLHHFYYESKHNDGFIIKHLMFDFTLLDSA